MHIFDKNYCDKQQGFILGTVLIIMLILSLLASRALELSLLQTKMVVNQRQNHELRWEAENGLISVIHTLQHTNNIVVSPPLLETVDSLLQPMWWQQYGKTISNAKANLTYVVENLGPNACLRIKGSKIAGVKFFRISIKASNFTKTYQKIIQAVYAQAFSLQETCHKPKRTREISAGIQSWEVL